MYVLGVQGNFGRTIHDPSAVLICDNKVIAAAEEERFIRYKHAVGLMPDRAIQYCLDEAGITMKDIEYIAFPRATWLDFKPRFEAYLWYNFGAVPKIIYIHHHTAHAASAYYISGFKSALVATFDKTGDGIACAIFRGNGTKLERLAAVSFPNSLGLFTSFITQYLGFKSNHDEYKVMGLASYGTSTYDLSNLMQIQNGEPKFNTDTLNPSVLIRYPFPPTSQQPIFKDASYAPLPPRRLKGDKITEAHKNLAASAQRLIEDTMIAFIKKYKTDKDQYLCLAGGVAENSVANGKIASEHLFKDIYVAPACGDAGSALGAALHVAVRHGSHFSRLNNNQLGPTYTNAKIEKILKDCKIKYRRSSSIPDDVANLLEKQNIVAWFQGRMEFGPRALGARSLLADPSNEAMRTRVNRIKRREQFRPFAPSVLEEHADKLFKTHQASPFMSFALGTTDLGKRQLIGATHVDFTGRLQTVPKDGSLYRKLIEAFFEKTGVPALLNTSLNSGWEPIVESPEQALAFFYSSEADVLVLNEFIILK